MWWATRGGDKGMLSSALVFLIIWIIVNLKNKYVMFPTNWLQAINRPMKLWSYPPSPGYHSYYLVVAFLCKQWFSFLDLSKFVCWTNWSRVKKDIVWDCKLCSKELNIRHPDQINSFPEYHCISQGKCLIRGGSRTSCQKECVFSGAVVSSVCMQIRGGIRAIDLRTVKSEYSCLNPFSLGLRLDRVLPLTIHISPNNGPINMVLIAKLV